VARADKKIDASAGTGSRSTEKQSPSLSAPKRIRYSRVETTERILDAAEQLFSNRDPKSVTVREIATEAGVTHALVHQYIGTKTDVFNAVMLRSAPQRTQMISEVPDLHTVMPLLVHDVLDRKVHSRALVRASMDGPEYSSLPNRIETGHALIALAAASKSSGIRRLPAPDALDPRVVMAAAVAMAYGWVACESWLVGIFELVDEDPSDIRSQLIDVFTYMVDLVLPPEVESDL
jgi:AcrR family transcriptional regulator